MRVDIVSFGQTRDKHFKALCREYAKRLERYGRFALHDLKESKRPDTATRLGEEAGAMRHWLEKRGGQGGVLRVAMDERGEPWTSQQLSESMAGWMVRSQRQVVFFIGSASGLDADFRQECEVQLALSAMTLPHEMAKMLLLEQLYRSMTILGGEPYHK